MRNRKSGLEKKLNGIKKRILGAVAGGIIGLSSLCGLSEPAHAEDWFVNPNNGSVLTSGALEISANGAGEPNDITPFIRYSKIPRRPAVTDNWWAFVQDVYANVNDGIKGGDIWTIYQGPEVEHQGKKIRITDSRKCGSPDLYENMLVYHKSDLETYPHWPSDIYLTDLTKINLENLVDIGDGLWAPSEARGVFETCITAGISNPDNPGNMDAQINGNYVVWRTGYYKPTQDNSHNHWKEVWMYNIDEEMAFPISNMPGNKWEPSIDGDWVAYGVASGDNYHTQWDVMGYNISTGKEFVINDDGAYSRSVRIYDDVKESGQAIVAFEYGYCKGANHGLGLARLKLDGSSVVVDPVENHYNIPKRHVTGHMCDWIDLFGLKGTTDEPGVGPFVVFGDYSGLNYGSGTNITGLDLRSGQEFNVASNSRWLYSPRGWVYRDTRNPVVVYRDDNFDKPQVGNSMSAMSASSSNTSEKSSALVVNSIKDRPTPEYCGGEGTIYYPGDVNQDCIVDLLDLSIFATNWLRADCTLDNGKCGGTDLNMDHKVDSEDYDIYVSNLGRRSFGGPDIIGIEPPVETPDFTVTHKINFYHDHSDEHEMMLEGYTQRIAKKRLYTYTVKDNTFGNIRINQVDIPATDIVSTHPGPDYEMMHEENVAKNWSRNTDGLVSYFTDNEKKYISAGREGHFFVIADSIGYQNKDVTVYTSVGPQVYSVPVPLPHTLKGDINRDGIVDAGDLSYLASNWGGKGLGDIYRDRKVDLRDFAQLAKDWDKKEAWHGENYIKH